MFSVERQSGRFRWWSSHSFSLAVHALLIALLVRGPAPQFLKPHILQQGERGTATITYLAGAAETKLVIPSESRLTFPTRKAAAKPSKRKLRPIKEPNPNDNRQVASVRAGLPEGFAYAGDYLGIAVRPALPAIFPDPPISRDDLPVGLSGDVIVEVTIDTVGHVVDTKLLKGLGPGIDNKVIATVRDWKFTPATWAGRPIASKHDVHFHYPS